MQIRWRLTIFNALAIGAILLLLGIALFFLLRESLLSSVEDTVKNRAVTAARTINSGDTLNDNAERLTLDGVFVIVRDRRGRVLEHTVNLNGGQDTVWRKAESSNKPASGAARLFRDDPDYVYAVPVDPPDGGARIVEAGKSYESAYEALGTVGTVLALGIGAALLLSIGGAYLLARAAMRPVDVVVSAAREMSEGDLSRRLPVTNPKDEIGRLATTINGLLARLEAAFARREGALTRQRRFAADASHELRTPLTSIRGYSRMLKQWGLEDPRTAREGVDAIDRESERMRSLVEALLALTRGDEGSQMEVRLQDLGEVAEEAVQTARAAADGKASLKYVPPKQKIKATFDRGRIRQAVLILLDNAIKYTPKGGSVEVRVSERDGDATLEVSDTGIGIPEEHLPLVFERFHRVDESRTEGGAGLGLSIARQILEAHGGTIEVESRADEGSTFTLLLPKTFRANTD